jgi:hypothetical protein
VHFQCTINELSIKYPADEEPVDQFLALRFLVTGNANSINRFRAHLARAEYDSESLVMLDE